MKLKNLFFYILKIFVVIGLFYLICRNISLSELFPALKNARPDYVIFAFLLMPLNIYVQYLKWRILTSDLKPYISSSQIIYTLFAGFFLGAVSPGRVAELGRGYLIKAHSQVKLAGLTAIDKAFNQVFILMFGFLGLASYAGTTGIALGLILSVLFVRILIGIKSFGPIFNKILGRLPFKNHTIHIIENFKELKRAKVWVLFFLTILLYITFNLQFILLILAFEPMNFLELLRYVVIIFIIKSALPISVADLGVKEVSSVVLLSWLGGMKEAAALDASLLHYFITFFLFAVIGGIVVAFKKREGIVKKDE